MILETGIIAWIVAYQPGELKVVAVKNGKEAATDKIITNTMPAKISAEVIEPTDNELLRQVRVKILDQMATIPFWLTMKSPVK
jgi:hypothetical protein